jgi:hypothetical protein
MIWLAVGKDGKEGIYTSKPIRGINILTNKETWLLTNIYAHYAFVPKGTIKRLINKDLTWKDDPVKI